MSGWAPRGQGWTSWFCVDAYLCSATQKALPFHFVSTQLVWGLVEEMKLAWAESCTVRKTPDGQYGELQYWPCASGSHFVMGPEQGLESGPAPWNLTGLCGHLGALWSWSRAPGGPGNDFIYKTVIYFNSCVYVNVY